MGIGEASAGNDTDEIDIDTPITAESFIAEKERQNTLKNISAGEIVDGRPIDPRVPPVKGRPCS